MMDLIGRQAVIDVLAAMQGRCTSKAALIQNSKIWQQIKDLPSAQTWIPVKERLPEEDEECIVTYNAEIVGAKMYHVSERIYPELVWWGKGKWTDCDGLSIRVNVTAWMPKPEPYVGG